MPAGATDPDIDAFEQSFARAERLAEGVAVAHVEAYIVAAKAVLMSREDEMDLDRLLDPKAREAFVDVMYQYYLERTYRFFQIDGSQRDPLKMTSLMQVYLGSTRAILASRVSAYGEHYTPKVHEEWRNELVKEVREQFRSSAAWRLSNRHVPLLVKSMGIGQLVDAQKMTIKDALTLYAEWYRQRALTFAQIKSMLREQRMDTPVWLVEALPQT